MVMVNGHGLHKLTGGNGCCLESFMAFVGLCMNVSLSPAESISE